MRSCKRCGGTDKIERHHIKHQVNGGTNDPDNLEDLCQHCHKYQHAKELLIDHIISAAEQLRRTPSGTASYRKATFNLKLNTFRLEVLETLNTPLMIRAQGYTPYITDYRTIRANYTA
jgi:hypothetical protein